MDWNKIDNIISNNIVPNIHLKNKITYKKIEKMLGDCIEGSKLCIAVDVWIELYKYSKNKSNITILKSKVILEPLVTLGSTIGFYYSMYKRGQYKKINKLSKIFFKALIENNSGLVNNILEAIDDNISYEYLMYFFNKPKNIVTDKTILETAILKNNVETLQFFTNKLENLNNSYNRIFYRSEINEVNNVLNNFLGSINEIEDYQYVQQNAL